MTDSTRRYAPTVDGWVVEDRRELTRSDGTTHLHVAWWYGPAHGWGNTWGPLDGSVRVFATHGDATHAAASAGVAIGHERRRETVIRKVDAAERDERQRVADRLARYETDGLDHPDADSIITANRDRLAVLDDAIAARAT